MIQDATLFLALLVAAFIVAIDPTWNGLAGACFVAMALGYIGVTLEDWLWGKDKEGE